MSGEDLRVIREALAAIRGAIGHRRLSTVMRDELHKLADRAEAFAQAAPGLWGQEAITALVNDVADMAERMTTLVKGESM